MEFTTMEEAREIAKKCGRILGILEGAVTVLRRLEQCPDGSLKNATIKNLANKLDEVYHSEAGI